MMYDYMIAMINDPWFLVVAALLIIGLASVGWIVYTGKDDWP